jgi:hypothetical protein
VALQAERDSLEERLHAAHQQAEAQRSRSELAEREWQEKAYAAEETVRALTAEHQELLVRAVWISSHVNRST